MYWPGVHVCMAVSNKAGAVFLLMGHACLLGYLNSFVVVVVLPPNALGSVALRAMVPYELLTFQHVELCHLGLIGVRKQRVCFFFSFSRNIVE